MIVTALSRTATGTATAVTATKDKVTFQLVLPTSASACTCLVMGSLNNANFVSLGSLTVNATTPSEIFSVDTYYPFYRGILTDKSGSGTAVLYMAHI